MSAEEVGGFDVPRPTTDPTVRSLYTEHQLGDAPTLRAIEPVATALLANAATLISGAELVLNRYIGSEDPVLKDLVDPELSGEDRFALVLMEAAFASVKLNPEDLKKAAILKATQWIEENREDLAPYLLDYCLSGAVVKGEMYYVSMSVNGMHGYEQFIFEVDLKHETIKQLE